MKILDLLVVPEGDSLTDVLPENNNQPKENIKKKVKNE